MRPENIGTQAMRGTTRVGALKKYARSNCPCNGGPPAGAMISFTQALPGDAYDADIAAALSPN